MCYSRFRATVIISFGVLILTACGIVNPVTSAGPFTNANYPTFSTGTRQGAPDGQQRTLADVPHSPTDTGAAQFSITIKHQVSETLKPRYVSSATHSIEIAVSSVNGKPLSDPIVVDVVLAPTNRKDCSLQVT